MPTMSARRKVPVRGHPMAWPGERVGLFDGEALLEHERRGREHDGDADAVGDEVGRVVGEHHLLAEHGGRRRRRRRRRLRGIASRAPE